MERFLVKTGIYSFVVSFSLLFTFFPRQRSTTDVNGMTSFLEISYPDYFFNITRWSIMVSLLAIIIMYFIFRFKKKKIIHLLNNQAQFLQRLVPESSQSAED